MHVVATAGHVDHGKSTLVRALTGIEPDRWAEEHRRGLTIDLGYAWTTLPSGEQLAFVDVPGHQRFIGNMLAGLGPAPAVVFVVAADEGWREQSEEHLAAVDALDIRRGLLVVTRSDLADPAPVLADASERLAATSLGPGPAVAVSARTGKGLPELRAALDRLVALRPAPDTDGRVRLWVDRSFTIRGERHRGDGHARPGNGGGRRRARGRGPAGAGTRRAVPGDASGVGGRGGPRRRQPARRGDRGGAARRRPHDSRCVAADRRGGRAAEWGPAAGDGDAARRDDVRRGPPAPAGRGHRATVLRGAAATRGGGPGDPARPGSSPDPRRCAGARRGPTGPGPSR